MNNLRRHGLALLPAAWMTLIWQLSADSSSGVQSLRLARWLWQILLTPLSGIVPTYPVLFATDTLARKAAHVTEYGIMAALFLLWLQRAWSQWGPARLARMALLLSVAWAGVDELHQSFVPGRAGKLSDVMIDLVGIGLVCYLWWRCRRPAAPKPIEA